MINLESLPLIVRELRVLARQGQIFWIRIIGGVAGFATLAFLLLQEVAVGATLGAQIFTALNAMLFATVLLVGPLVTCDCIAVEKREGTLGLLFLAPLTGRSIVLSKLAVNAFRAFTLLLAVLPMMALPVVFGGIDGAKLFWAGLLQLTALCIALSAGILASTLHRTYIQTAVLGEIYALGFGMICAFFMGFSPFVGAVLGLLITVNIVELCSKMLKNRWEIEGAQDREPLWVRPFAESETSQMIFHWDTRRARSVNPIAWLQEYSWSARLAKWGWFGLAIVAEFYLMAESFVHRPGTVRPQIALATFLLLGIALTGANSFRQERLSGAMELLLVTPLSPLKIMLGRLWGVWVHFFPAILIVVLMWFSAGSSLFIRPAEGWVLLSAYFFVPVIGLYVSLLPWNILVAWAVVFLVGAVAPVNLALLLETEVGLPSVAVAIILQATMGGAAFALLHRKLKTRNFTLASGSG